MICVDVDARLDMQGVLRHPFLAGERHRSVDKLAIELGFVSKVRARASGRGLLARVLRVA